MPCCLEHLHGNAVACKCNVPVPIPSQVAQPPTRRQLGVMEWRLAQNPDSSLWHHMLAAQDLQQCSLPGPIASQQQAPRPSGQGYGHVLHHWRDTRQGPSICVESTRLSSQSNHGVVSMPQHGAPDLSLRVVPWW